MKILHIIDSGGVYGAEAMLLNLVTEQVQMGLKPFIASIGVPCRREKSFEVEARRRGLRVQAFRMRPGPNIAGAFRILRFARYEGIEILHSHGYKGNILFGLMPKRIRKIPMVATLHGWTWTGGWDRMRLYEWLDRLSLRFIDRVIVVTEGMKERVGNKKVHVVNNGIPSVETDLSTHNSAPLDSIDPTISAFCGNCFTIGAIGRLSPEKGYDILLDAVSELAKTTPEIRLVILGEGDQRSLLEAQINKLRIEERVLMPGYVAHVGRYLSLFKVFALSSLTEGLPIVILEAMQARLPIVATRVGGVPEVLENGKAGLLITPGSCEALVHGISEVINNKEKATQRADAAAQRLNDCYSCHTMAEKYLYIYQSL